MLRGRRRGDLVASFTAPRRIRLAKGLVTMMADGSAALTSGADAVTKTTGIVLPGADGKDCLRSGPVYQAVIGNDQLRAPPCRCGDRIGYAVRIIKGGEAKVSQRLLNRICDEVFVLDDERMQDRLR